MNTGEKRTELKFRNIERLLAMITSYALGNALGFWKESHPEGGGGKGSAAVEENRRGELS